jgi:methyltransferase
MNAQIFLLSLVIGLMVAESRLSARHIERLRQQGAVEPPGDPYLALSLLYVAAFVLMGAEGIWRAASGSGASAAALTAGPAWAASGGLLFIASKGLKYWAIGTLGERWSFRVLVQPGLPLIRTGPYRYVAHPNYIAVVGELAGAAMMFGAKWSAPVMLPLVGVALWARVRFETRVLRAVSQQGTS